MRGPLAIAALSTALLATPLLAQMHGGSHSGGSMGRGGFSSSASVGFRGSTSLSSARNFGAGFGTGLRQPSFPAGRSFVGFRQPFLGSRRFQGPFFGPRRFRRSLFFSGGSPLYFGYYGYPYYDSGYAYAPDYYPAYDYYASENAAQNDLARQEEARQQEDIDRLEDEVARLREQRESRAPRTQAETSEPSTPTLLVFRDKHTQEVQNYAVVGGTLWIFSEQKATKLPLSWLDIEATTKANDDRGVDFQIPR
jgi:hypothetical protein